MKPTRRRLFAIATAVFIVAVVALWPRTQVAADTLPKQLSDRAFWKLVETLSEPGGFFRSDNFLSNETTYQEVIPELRKRATAEGVYLGVGPDQNFTYITALHPRMAFIVDIRRQNMLEHLMYKALIEASTDRIDFLSRLFSRPRPAGIDKSSSPKELFAAFGAATASEPIFQQNVQDMLDRLTKRHGFTLSEDDRRSMEYVLRAFFPKGQSCGIRFRVSSSARAGFRPTPS